MQLDCKYIFGWSKNWVSYLWKWQPERTDIAHYGRYVNSSRWPLTDVDSRQNSPLCGEWFRTDQISSIIANWRPKKTKNTKWFVNVFAWWYLNLAGIWTRWLKTELLAHHQSCFGLVLNQDFWLKFQRLKLEVCENQSNILSLIKLTNII